MRGVRCPSRVGVCVPPPRLSWHGAARASGAAAWLMNKGATALVLMPPPHPGGLRGNFPRGRAGRLGGAMLTRRAWPRPRGGRSRAAIGGGAAVCAGAAVTRCK